MGKLYRVPDVNITGPTVLDDSPAVIVQGRRAQAALRPGPTRGGDRAPACRVTVLVPAYNEAASLADTIKSLQAQTFAIPSVRTEFVMAIDADTTLAPDATETLRPAFDDPDVAAACGFVLPRFVETVWERGRYIEYLL